MTNFPEVGIVSILSIRDAIVGTGFVVSHDGLIITCAHVIKGAGVSIGGMVAIVFHSTKDIAQATVSSDGWRDVNEEDVAILQLQGNLPEGVKPLPLSVAKGASGHPFHSFGYPKLGSYHETHVWGVIDGLIHHDRILQISSAQVSPGVSGAPVFDINRKCVVGMISEFPSYKDKAVNRVIAGDKYGRHQDSNFAIPTEVLIEICPPLQKYITQSWYEAPLILPQPLSTNFTGRTTELAQLESMLISDDKASFVEETTRVVAVTGTGGIGKSTLVCQFATTSKYHFPDGVIGIKVGNNDTNTIVRQFARTIGRKLDDDDDRPVHAIMQHMFANRKMLLIFDDVQTHDISHIRQLQPGGKCAVIITTRHYAMPSQLDIQHIHLTQMSDEETWDFLAKLVGHERLEQEPTWAVAIGKLTGNLPLAIKIVGKTLQRRPQYTLEKYVTTLELEQTRLNRFSNQHDSDLDVRARFKQSIEFLEEAGLFELVEIFAQLSVCADIGFSLKAACAVANVNNSEWIAEEMLERLVDFSLLSESSTPTPRYVFHPLLRLFAHELSVERELYAGTARRHAEFFVDKVHNSDINNIDDSNALMNDLDNLIIAAMWLKREKIPDYKFAVKLNHLFKQYAQWQNGINVMNDFALLAHDCEDWERFVYFRIQQAKFYIQGEYLIQAENLLTSNFDYLRQIKSPVFRKTRMADWYLTLGRVLLGKGSFHEAMKTLRQSHALYHELADRKGLSNVLDYLDTDLTGL